MIIIASYSNVSVTYTANGTQTVFSFPFDYLRKAFVYVETDGEPLEQGTDFSVYEKTVVFTTAPTAGTKLRIYRETETIPLVSWADASVLKAKDMTIQQVQVLHILEEYKGQYNEDLANMLIIAGIVTDSDELQHIVNQFNTIDTNTQKAVNAANTATIKEASATASATSAAGSATSATNTANALVTFLETKETLTAPAVDPTLTINNAAADAKVTGKLRSDVDITPLTLALTHGYYVYKDGNLSGGGTSNFDYSSPIAVLKGQRVEIVAAGYSVKVAMISTCNSDGTNIVPMAISIDSNVHTYEYIVAEDGYIMFSFHTPEGYIASVFGIDTNIVLGNRMNVAENAIRNNLELPIINSETFEQGSLRNGSKVDSNFALRFKDGYYVTNPSKVTVVPNGQYASLDVWYTRTVTEGEISFSNLAIPLDTWSNQQKEFYIPAGCWLTLNVRKTYPTNTQIKPIDNLVQMYVADNQIFKNRQDIIDLQQNGLGGSVPEYWETEIDRVKTEINNNRLTIGNRIAEFFFITDVHWRLNAQKSITLMNSLKKHSGIKILLMGGDVVATHTETQISAIEEIREFYQHLNEYRVIFTIGNHDLNSNNNSSHPEAYLTANQLYSCCMSNEEMFTNTNASPYVTIYDNESQKVRFIQFYHPDIISIPASVQTEVINAVQEKGTDWTVFMMCHVYWSGGSVDQYITAFTQQLAGLNASGNYAKIGALIVGHMHDDKSVVVNNNLLVIGSNCDIYAQSQGQETMTRGTDTEQSFDVFQVDLVNHKIYITRVGAGNDRQFSY